MTNGGRGTMFNDFKDKAVLITGGTTAIGLATGLAFARQGAHVYLTHLGGSADAEDVLHQFSSTGAPDPIIVEADASKPKETLQLLERIAQHHQEIEVFVSNVGVTPERRKVEDLSKNALFESLEHGSWPVVDHLQKIHQRFSRFPRYVIGVSSDRPNRYCQGGEFVGASEAVMEVFCRYLTQRLAREDVRINIVRTPSLFTVSASAVHGSDYSDFMREYAGNEYFVQPQEVGNTILALCSGLLDAMSGQVVTVDRGTGFGDSLMQLYQQREKLGL